jgi:nucleoside-diphosphate-sugar epimerase
MGAEALEPVILGAAVGEIRDQHLDPTAAREVLHWSASITLEDGLERTNPWYRKRRGATRGRLS